MRATWVLAASGGAPRPSSSLHTSRGPNRRLSPSSPKKRLVYSAKSLGGMSARRVGIVAIHRNTQMSNLQVCKEFVTSRAKASTKAQLWGPGPPQSKQLSCSAQTLQWAPKPRPLPLA